jgi:hypothetical protein
MVWKEVSSIIWQWDTGEHKVLEGQLDDIETFEAGKFGVCMRYFVITPDQGRVSFIGGQAFDRMFERADIQVGDYIRVEYCGKKDIGRGQRINLFKLWKDVPEPEE